MFPNDLIGTANALVDVVGESDLKRSSAHGPLKLHIPSTCVACAAVGRLTLETAIVTGDTVLLHWRCARCSQSWPVTTNELVVLERRQGVPDRRDKPRTDRRNQ